MFIQTQAKIGIALIIAIFFSYAVYFVMNANATALALDASNAQVAALTKSLEVKDKEIATLKKLGEVVNNQVTIYTEETKHTTNVSASVKKKLSNDTAIILRDSTKLGNPPTVIEIETRNNKLSKVRIDALWEQHCQLFGCPNPEKQLPPVKVTSDVVTSIASISNTQTSEEINNHEII